MLDLFFHSFSFKDIILDLILLAVLIIAWFVPQVGSSTLTAFEKFGALLAKKNFLAILFISILAILIRISLLWLVPVPVPITHDEFSYLLAGDTFAHGRLTNPPHAMRVFLDTFHVNQVPTYMSKYPPLQGGVLALGQLLGHPWIGVVLSVAGMCAAVLWMLQGWLPSQWALLGAMLVFFRLGIFSYWMNSFWGGAVPAIGGALVMGAFPRILRSLRGRDALLLGSGAAILMNSRPLEGFILCLPVTAVLLVQLFGKHAPPWRAILCRFVLPLAAIAAASAAFFFYYNWRVTRNPFLQPYMVNERTYVSTPTLLWQKLKPPIHFENPQFNDFYNDWMRNEWLKGRSDSLPNAFKHISLDIMKFVNFFTWPELCIPLLALPWMLFDQRVRFLLVQGAICFSGFLLVAWFQPHYAAPLVATVFTLIVQALRHLRRWECGGRPVGIGLTRVIVIFAVILAPFHPHASSLWHTEPVGIEYRAKIESQLEGAPGMHLIIVRYAHTHPVLKEWVYNRADIDHAKVVWAREIVGIDSKPLLNYFQGRHVWLLEPDQPLPHLTPYTE